MATPPTKQFICIELNCSHFSDLYRGHLLNLCESIIITRDNVQQDYLTFIWNAYPVPLQDNTLEGKRQHDLSRQNRFEQYIKINKNPQRCTCNNDITPPPCVITNPI